MKNVSNITLKIFAIGILACLFAGGFSLVGYVIALLIGGEVATNICAFVFTVYLPIVIQFTSIFAGVGLIGMYISKQKALTVSSEDDKK